MREGKLTKAQREVLEWLGTVSGVTDIYDQRVINALMRKGLVDYDGWQSEWRISPLGRAALNQEDSNAGR